MRFIGYFYVFLAFSVLCGCKGKDDEVAFAIIDGWPLTVSQVSNAVQITARIRELSKRPIPEKRFARWANGFAMKVIPGLLSARLWECEIRRQGLTAEEIDRQTVLGRYAKRLKSKAKTIDELAPLFGDLESVFRAQFERECLFETYRRRNFDNEVSESAVESYCQAVSNQMVQSERINADAKKRGDDIWTRLNKGEDWMKVAKECTEDAKLSEDNKDYWKEWETFVNNNCLLDEVKEVLPTIPVGGISKPLDTDEGLVIVKVLKREGNETTCARILLRLAYLYEIPKREAARAKLLKEQLEDNQLELLQELKEKAVIEYPLGTNFTYRIWAEPEKSERTRKGLTK